MWEYERSAFEFSLTGKRRSVPGRETFCVASNLSQVCLATGNDEIGRPILQELAEEIERLGLEAWEGTDVIAPPLSLLYRWPGAL